MASVTLDFDAGHIAPDLEPDIDDLGRSNVVIASRRNGGEVTDSDTTGPLGTAAIGAYRSQIDINPETDDVLPQHAHYHLILGTDPDPRYPQVVVDLDANPDLATDVSAIDIGDLIALQSLPQDLGQPTADTLTLGYTETIGSHRRIIRFNTRPGAILTNVGQLDGEAGACLQTAGAELVTAITGERVSFDVSTTVEPIFTTSPPTGARIIVNDREVMTVTGIASVATDSYTRTEATGLGTATSGQVYTLNGAASEYSVDGTNAVITPSGVSDRAGWIDVGSPNQHARIRLNTNTTPTGSTIRYGMVMRVTDAANFYRIAASIPTSGLITIDVQKRVAGSLSAVSSLATTMTMTANDVYLEASVIGTDIRVRIYNVAVAAPTWQHITSDSSLTTGNGVGPMFRRDTGNTGPTSAAFDDFEVYNPQTFVVARDPEQRMTHPVESSVKVYRPLSLTL